MNEIEKLNERIVQLTDLVKSGEETISATKEMLKLAEQERDRLADQRRKSEPKFERVEFGHNYYYVASYSEGIKVCKESEDHTSTDNGFYDSNNYFYTKERAQEVADKINLLLKLERLHDTFCQDYVPDWNDKDKVKYYVFKNKFISISRWDIGYVSTSDISDVYFPTEEIAKKVCDILNAEERSKDV